LLNNLITGFLSRGFIALFNLLVLLLCSRYLGSEVLGTMSLLILNIAIIQAINDIYAGPAIVYFVPRTGLRGLYLKGLLWTLVCVAVMNLLFAALYPGMRMHWQHVLVLSLLACFIGFHNMILLGRERIVAYYIQLFIQPALLLCALSLSIFSFHIEGSRAYILSLYVSWTITFCVSAIHVLRELGGSRKDILPAISMTVILAKGSVNQLGNLAHTLSNRFNYYVLAAAASVGVYAGASSLIESVWIISAGISPLVLSHIANQRDQPNHARITLMFARLCFAFSLVCVIALYFIPGTFFTWLLGKDFSGVKTIMLLLSPGVLLVSFSSIISHYYSGQGRQKVLLIANSCGLVVTLSLSYLLISSFGLKGAAYTASLSYAAQAVYLVVLFMRENGFSFGRLFRLREDLQLLRT
jgi:O-antigen/teichoic acid export membrane protein